MIEIGQKNWGSMQDDGSGLLYPSDVQFRCRACDMWAYFPVQDCQSNPNAAIRSAVTTCPACKHRVQLVLIYELRDVNVARKPLKINVLDASENQIELRDFSASLDSRVAQVVESAVRAHNSGRYAEASSGARRALEGLLKTSLIACGNSVGDLKGKSLFSLIETATQQLDFSAPIKKLASLVKDGGNLGSHFDFDGEPSVDLTRKQLFLIHYLIDYLHELPKQIGELEDELA